MGCNCGKARTEAMTAAAIEAQRLEQRIAEETAKAASGEHDPKPLVRVIRR